MKIKLILIRHGETEKNISNSLHGVNDPEKLNTIGLDQINKTANELLKYIPVDIYCSDEPRALESAEIISKKLKTELTIKPNLKERNWGIFTGKPWTDVKKVLDTMTLDERYNYSPENGESWKDFENRLINSLKNILNKNESKNVIIITHGGVIRALMPFLLNIPKEESFKYDPANASITIFDYDGKGFEKIMIDNTDHLK